MRLFTVGPVEMYDSTLEIAGSQLPYFRTREFSEEIGRAHV
jgi:aspartate aminotransferase-like enzyme